MEKHTGLQVLAVDKPNATTLVQFALERSKKIGLKKKIGVWMRILTGNSTEEQEMSEPQFKLIISFGVTSSINESNQEQLDLRS